MRVRSDYGDAAGAGIAGTGATPPLAGPDTTIGAWLRPYEASSQSSFGRLTVSRLPLLRSHVGTPPDLVLRWNRIESPGPVDVVIHLHGFSGRRVAMSLVRDKEPASGLDFADPQSPDRVGRRQPTIGLIPRGHYYGGKSGNGYAFPALLRAGAIGELVTDALARFTEHAGIGVTPRRLIITAHSGGGAALGRLLAHSDPDEIHIFDGLYSPADAVIRWALGRLNREGGVPSAVRPALRILFIPGTATAPHSESVARALRPVLERIGQAELAARFRVDATRVGHSEIPARYGWLLLADAGADLPNARSVLTPTLGTQRESADIDRACDAADAANAAEITASVAPSEAEQSLYESMSLQEALADEGMTELYDIEGDAEADAQFAQSSLDHLDVTDGLSIGDDWDAYTEDSDEQLDYDVSGQATYDARLDDSDVSSRFAADDSAWADAGYPESADADDLGEFSGDAFPSGLVLSRGDGATGQDQEHWDPNATGLPLLATPPSVQGERLSPNFTVRELVSSGGRASDVARISPALVRALQAVRDHAGRAVSITSGYRSWAVNKALYEARGQAPTHSRHCSGQAADIKVSGLDGLELAKLAVDAVGADLAIGIGRDFVHLDVRGQPTTWSYHGDQAAERALDEHRRARRAGGPPRPATPSTPGGDRQAGIVRQTRAQGCTGSSTPGADALAAQWRRLTGRRAGRYNCRPIAGSNSYSLHSEGRAVDAYANAADPTERAQGDAYAEWLTANAVELQVPFVIWNRRQWSWPRRTEGWRPYGGASPHTDHLHIELSWEGARQPSPLFAGNVPGLPSGAAAGPAVPSRPTPRGPSPANYPAPTPAPSPPAHTSGKLAPRDFVAAYGPHARASEQATGVPALVTLAQAALESGWGERAPRFNFFGIKARASDPPETRQLLRTREVFNRPDVTGFPEILSVTPRTDGRYDYIVRDWFRAYPDASSAFRAHGEFLRRNARYRRAFDRGGDPFGFASEVARAGYATDPSYESKLHTVMRMLQRAGA
jgi:hypothetical protein